MKGFYDLIILSRMFEFQGPTLARAILATFSRRKTSLPAELPVGLTATFATDPSKLAQWTAFLRKSGAAEPGELATIIDEIVGFVWQPLEAASRGGAFELRWPPAGPWQT